MNIIEGLKLAVSFMLGLYLYDLVKVIVKCITSIRVSIRTIKSGQYEDEMRMKGRFRSITMTSLFISIEKRKHWQYTLKRIVGEWQPEENNY